MYHPISTDIIYARKKKKTKTTLDKAVEDLQKKGAKFKAVFRGKRWYIIVPRKGRIDLFLPV